MNIDEKSRALKDIEKLDRVMHEFVKLKLHEKYPQIYEWAKNYANDAKHYYEKGDYFTSFGCANYAYGFIDCVLIMEGKKKDETEKIVRPEFP